MKKPRDYVIGIDLGTSSCKTIILAVSGECLGFGTAGYAAENLDVQWKEQNPESLYIGLLTSVKSALTSCSGSTRNCLGMSVGGALHSIMAVDRAFRPISGVLTWADMRATKQSEFIANNFDTHKNYLKNGCPNNPMYPLAKILWMKEENEAVFDRADKFISAKEYILWKLTGERAVDYAIASGSGLFNIVNLEWDPELLATAGIGIDQVIPAEEPLYLVGELSEPIRKELGLQNHPPVFLGSADAVNSSLGAGTIGPASITCMVGSSGAVRTISSKPILDREERLWCYCIDKSHWLVGGAINNGGLALEWLRGVFNKSVSTNGDIDFDQLLEWASESPALAEGLICLPFFTSERSPYWNPHMKAIFWGVSLNHDHRHVSQAILEGIGYRLKSVQEALIELVGQPKTAMASGGFVKSDHWVKTLASILATSIQIPRIGETSALGAAYWVLLSLGIYEDFDSLSRINMVERIITPDKEIVPFYQSAYSIYKEIYRQNRDIFNSLK